MAFKDYSATPSENTELEGPIYIGPNMFRDDVRPALQQIAADGRDLYDELHEEIAAIPAGPPGAAGDGAVVVEDYSGAADATSGAVGTNNSTPFVDAIGSQSYGASVSVNYVYGPKIRTLLGGYRHNSEVDLQKIVNWEGLSSGFPLQGVGGNSVLYFPTDTRGITVNPYNARAGSGPTTAGTAATGSKIQGLYLKSDGGTDITRSGGWVRTQVIMRDMMFAGFPGSGLKVIANNAGSGADYGNANGSYFERITTRQSGRHGFEISGNDANGLTFVAPQCLSASACGIKDTDTLGNVYVSAQIDSFGENGKGFVTHGGVTYMNIGPGGAATTPGTNATIWYPLGPLESGGAGASAWSGAGDYEPSMPIYISGLSNRGFIGGGYTEGGLSDISNSLAIAVGGQMTFTRNSRHLTARSVGRAVFCNSGIGGYQSLPPAHFLGDWLYSSVGSLYEDGVILETAFEDNGGHIHKWRYFSDKSIGFTFDSTETRAFGYTVRGTTVKFGKSSETDEGTFFANKFALGGAGGVLDDFRRFEYAAAGAGGVAPTTGQHASGEIRWNQNPYIGNPIIGRVCIAGGTPGTWRLFSSFVIKDNTATRPTLGATDVGLMYLDTTLAAAGKPIWWTGSAWVDATGATV